MASRLLPVLLVLAAAAADAEDRYTLGFYLLVAAVPAAAVAALWSFGELVESEDEAASAAARVHALLGALVLVCVLVASAARAQGTDAGSVPAASGAALLVCLALFAAQGLLALATGVAPTRAQNSR